MVTLFSATGGHFIFHESSVQGFDIGLDLADCSVDVQDSSFIDVDTVLRGRRLGKVNAERVVHVERNVQGELNKSCDPVAAAAKELGGGISVLADIVRRAANGYV